MKVKVTAVFICVLLCFSALPLFVFHTTAAQSSAFIVEISTPTMIFVDDNITVTFSLKEITTPLSGVEFVFYFDNTLLTPSITENADDEMNAFIKSSPQDGWEQLCRYDGERSCYILRFSAPDGGIDESTLVKDENALVIVIPFTVAAAGDCTLSVPDNEIIGIDSSLNILKGTGGDSSFTITENAFIRPIEDSGLTRYTSEETGYITGIKENTPISELLELFTNSTLVITDNNGSNVTSGICMTGYTIKLYREDAISDSAVIIIKGDVNRDGRVTSADYLFVKRAFLGTVTLNTVQLQASYLKGNDAITAVTYLMLKRHVLGTYNLHD